MEQHAGLSFDSYDRLFPNQDHRPTGGFGNLIALPLQHGPRQRGDTAFIDERFVPYPDQWAYLSSLQRLSPTQLTACLERLDTDKAAHASDLKPWEKGLPVTQTAIAGCPAKVTLTLANRIYVPFECLPQALLARLKRLASFSNPAFFQAQRLRLPTQGTPRYICLAHVEQEYLSLPRGCLDGTLALLKEQAITVKMEDLRKTGKSLARLTFKGKLRKDQAYAVDVLAKHAVGVLHAPTAFGKTVTAIGLIQRRKVNTLILVHSRQLLDQWQERLNAFLTGATVGMIGGGKHKPSDEIDVATYQSLINRSDNSVSPVLFNYGQIIIDECHHISAPTYETLLSEVHAKYVLGVTATPQRQDGHQPIIFMQAGPIRHRVKNDQQSPFEQRVLVQKLTTPPPPEWQNGETRPHIAEIYRWLMQDASRNQRIVNDVLTMVEKQHHPLVLTERREHALQLAEALSERGILCQVLRGAMKTKERDAVMAALDDTQVLIATGKYIGEGFDLPKLDTLFLALPISWRGSLAQYAGRIHRQVDGKTRVTIYDYVDSTLPTLQRMYQRRVKGYEAMGYTLADSPEQALVQVSMDLQESPDIVPKT